MRVAPGIRSLLFVPICILALNGCNSGDGGPPAKRPAATAASAALAIHTHVTQVDERTSTPTFAFVAPTEKFKLPVGATPVDVAWGTLRAAAQPLKLPQPAIAAAHIASVHDTGRGPVITRFHQRVDGVDVFRAELNVTMKRDMTPVAVSGALAPSLKSLSKKGWAIDARTAVANAFRSVTGVAVDGAGFTAIGTDGAGLDRYGFAVTSGNATLYGRARVKRVWYQRTNGLLPAYYVEVDVANSRHTDSSLNSFVIHAGDGSQLFTHNMVAADKYSYRVWADGTGPKGMAPMDSPYGNGMTPNVEGVFDANALPPSYLFPSLVNLQNIPFSQNDPWLPTAAAELAGNNVHAYADLVAPDGLSAGDVTVPPTSPGVFDRTWDPTTLPGGSTFNIQAITTNLFFVVNYMHDLYYDSGYNEAAGNSQNDNYGRGGVGSDAINAESQDYSGLDNANMSTPSDGAPGRMQMYLWDLVIDKHVTINTPGPTTLTTVGSAVFGPQSWNVTNDVVLYLDTTGGGSLGCNTGGGASNAAALAGKIALIDRGTCAFVEKAKNALTAGAVAVLFANSATGAMLGSFGAADPGLTNFPGMLVTNSDGASIKAALAAGTVNVTLVKGAPNRDGSVDGTIISHEWGHSLSHRLINNSNGLNTTQSNGMGEGWSDFVALTTYVRPTDLTVASNANWMGVYPMGTYALGAQPKDIYFGIRRYPYSNDLTKNPLTFKHIQNGTALPTSPPPAFGADGSSNAEVHNTGEVWTSMLWDCFVGLQRDTTNYTYATALQATRDYLVASLKLTPSDPTFTEARDAWLAAALANTGKPNDLATLATAFAHRGAGTGAISPPRESTDNVGVTESFVTGNDLAFVSASLTDDIASCDNDGVLDSGETGNLTVTMHNVGINTLTAATVTLSSTNPNISFPNGATMTFASTAPFAKASVKVPVSLTGVTAFTTFDIKIDINAPNLVPTPGPRSTTLTLYGNYDWIPTSSATDNNDAPTTLWTTTHNAALPGNPTDWVRQPPATGFGLLWFGQDVGAEADLSLVSPPLSVGTGPFSFTFKHHYSMEADTTTNPITYFDAGVLELSNDGGTTWTDIGSSITANGYTASATVFNDPTNDPTPLAGRPGFLGDSPGYPADIVSTVSLGTTYSGQTIQIRFRIGTDQGGSAVGWFVDDMAFTGLTNTPFTSLGAQSPACAPPVANAGPNQTVNEATMVTLDGSASTASGGKTLHYHWSQTMGPTATLSSATVVMPTFTAPAASADTPLQFQLIVDDGTLTSGPSSVTITDKHVVVVIPPDMTMGPPDMAMAPVMDMATAPTVDMATGPDLATAGDMSTGGGGSGGSGGGGTNGVGGKGGCSCDVSGRSSSGDNRGVLFFAVVLIGFALRRARRA
jgi:hypothetical protein